MAEPLDLAPAPRAILADPPAAAPGPALRRRLGRALRRHRRPLLLGVLPLLALIGGVMVYLGGGRYVTTDNAYVGAQKVLITPDVAGKIVAVAVKEGQHVEPGDELFQIDPVPYRLAVAQARARLADARTGHANLVDNLRSYQQTIELINAGIGIKRRDVDRKSALTRNLSGSQLDLDNAQAALVTAQAQLQLVERQKATALNQLLGDPELPLAQFPAYAQAQAALEDAERNLALATVRAPMNGTATQVDNIQLGRYVTAGTPVFSVIDTSAPWVDANPKEGDFTYVAVGQSATLEVDAFPDHVFHGTVSSLSPGTGAQFALLPPQNATGNFVKVVQRVPLRITLDHGDAMVRKLKAGMSVYVSIDTHRRRSLAKLLGFGSAAAQPKPKPD